ncbi:MAG: SMI1/KNR4 family protein [Acidobacteriota bacterium]|nr:SMI1/KNR4 family protein [Acidobacteriota bacterium]
MSLFERLEIKSDSWTCEPPASEAEIQNLVSHFGSNLPNEYLDLLRFCNGGEGDLALEPVLFRLWSTDEVIEANQDLQVSEFLPGFVMFGGDGANELFGFRLDASDTKIYMIPMIVMSEEDAKVVAENFTEFIDAIGREYKETDT